MSHTTLLELDSFHDAENRLALEDEVLVGTDAAGGIGRYVACALAVAGADVALVDRDIHGPASVKTAIEEEVDRKI